MFVEVGFGLGSVCVLGKGLCSVVYDVVDC